MCGIVGFISTDEKSWKNAKYHFSHFALTLDTLRGGDSTGLIQLRNNFDVHVQHTTAAGDKFVHMPEYQEFMKEDMWALVGHNRAATAGSVKLENAHPFTYGAVTMVHNGTLWQRGRSLPGFCPKRDVDSMNIAFALSEVEPDKAKEVLEKIDGSFTLVWTDTRDQSLNMARNSERPMHFGFNQQKDIMWFMSDGHHLNAINTSFRKSGCKIQQIYSMDRMKLLKWKKGDLSPEVESFSPFVKPIVVSQHPEGGITRRNDGKALARAAESWLQNRAGANDLTIGSSAKPLTWINCERRRIPKPHIEELYKYYELEPDALLEFIPDKWMEMGNRRCVVYGTFYHDGWGYMELPMVLYDVPLVTCTAYSDKNWAVHAKGVTNGFHPYDGMGHLAVLAEYYSHDAKGMFLHDEEIPQEEDEVDDTGMVVGPDNYLMTRTECMEMIKDGCMQCGKDIAWEERATCMPVNENRNVLCPGCATEWLKEAL